MWRNLDQHVAPVHGKMCDSHAQKTCRILVKKTLHRFHVDLLEMSQITVIWLTICCSHKMAHFTQFSEAAREPCMLHCMLSDLNGTKCAGNAPSIPAQDSRAATENGMKCGISCETDCWPNQHEICVDIYTRILHVYMFYRTRFHVCIGLSRPKHPPKVKYFFVIVACSAYWPFSSKTPSQSKIFFQSYSLACSLCSCVTCIGLWRPKQPPKVKYFLLL